MLHIEKILAPLDFSPCSDRALQQALELARRTGAVLHTLFAEVLHGDPFGTPTQPATPAAKLRARIKQLIEEEVPLGYDPASVQMQHTVVRGLAPGPAILEYAEDKNIDLIVMGTHGRRGVRHLLLGSVAEEVVRLAPCPVLTVGGTAADARPFIPWQRILVPVDFSSHAREALVHAKALAGFFGAGVDLLHVVEDQLHPAFYNTGAFPVYAVQPVIRDRARVALERFYVETSGPEGPTQYAIQSGHAATEILRYAAAVESDLIVMSTHGLTGLEHFFVGSVAEKVVRAAPCPVYTVKAFARAGIALPSLAG